MNAILSVVIFAVILTAVNGQSCGWGAPYGGCKSKVSVVRNPFPFDLRLAINAWEIS